MDGLIFENSDLNSKAPEEKSSQADQQDAIAFSDTLIAVFEDLAEETEDITVEDLKSVYRESESSYDNDKDYNLNIWGLAKVNMFVRQKIDGSIAELICNLDKVEVRSIKALEESFNVSSLKEELEDLDMTKNWQPSKEDFELAESLSAKYDLKFSFSSLDELYIEEYKPLELELE
jgi:hypothetical protein